VPQPKRDIELPFLMPIEDIFSISGRGTVVTGRIERQGEGGRERGDRRLPRDADDVCTGVEMFKKQLGRGTGGDNAGSCCCGTPKEDVERGMVLAKPASIYAAHQLQELGVTC